ncbi:NB-ARC domain-containing protein [Actinoplanes sp. CA-142083]|uniref:NB-ARC domain-containing protein n=1 Tax=Actinoplanes sp. CA-142083 TaxID=3239903 RepID=UPI003D93D182
MEVVTALGGAAGRLASQFVVARFAGQLAARRALDSLIAKALIESLGSQVDADGGDAEVMRIRHIETLLGRFLSRSESAGDLVDAVVRRREPPIAELTAEFAAGGGDPATIGLDVGALFEELSVRLRAGIDEHATVPQSPLFPLVVVSDLDHLVGARGGRRILGSAPPPPPMFVGRDDDMRRLRDRLGRGDDVGLRDRLGRGDDVGLRDRLGRGDDVRRGDRLGREGDVRRGDQGGREGDVRLGGRLGHGSSLQVVTAVRGWPGVGKTTTAAALAHDPQLAADYPDGILWARLGETDAVASELRSWLSSLEAPADAEATVPQLSARLAAVLRDRRMLLFVDDVWDARQAAPFLVGGRSCATVVTTRARAVADDITSGPDQVYLLDVLSLDAAVEILASLTGAFATERPEQIRRLAEALEGLPLALQVAGRLIASEQARGLPVDDLADELAQGARLLEAKAPAHLATVVAESSPTVASLFRRSIADLDPGTQLRFAYIGAFAPKPAVCTIAQLTVAWAGLGDAEPATTIGTLVDRGLLETSGPGVYQMHGLLATFARSLATVL